MLWELRLAQPGLGGIAATEKYVLFGDRDLDDFQDVWRCLHADTGEPVWEIQQLAIGKLDYGNSPRATPLIDGERAYLFGAFGHLLCVELETGETIWSRSLSEEFKLEAELAWGYCGTPLLADGKLILSPGAEEASLIALDPEDGSLLWKVAGNAPSYGSLIVSTFGGRQQVVGHDATTLGGWDLASGERLWTLTPELDGDFNVPTPLAIDGKLLITTENNGTRLYRFGEDGVINPNAVMRNRKLKPDMSSPVVVGNRLFCVNRFLYGLDLSADLKEVWRARDKALSEYGSIIASGERLLVASKQDLILVDAGREPRILDRLRVFDEALPIYSHPALVDGRLYIRGETTLKCIAIE